AIVYKGHYFPTNASYHNTLLYMGQRPKSNSWVHIFSETGGSPFLDNHGTLGFVSLGEAKLMGWVIK
ncbi:MAG: hypothetical protein MN733_34935, partial [Nitrososphaera sp.]|nr:hypothetical protein [Nitrososphaera sp.]